MATVSIEIPDEQLPVLQGVLEQLISGLQVAPGPGGPGGPAPLAPPPGPDGMVPPPPGAPPPMAMSPEEEAALAAELNAMGPNVG